MLALVLSGCGGGGGGSGDDGPTFSDPANQNGTPPEEQVLLDAITLTANSEVESSVVDALRPLEIRVRIRDGNKKPQIGKPVNLTTSLGQLDTESGDVLTDSSGYASARLSVASEKPGTAGTVTVTYKEVVQEVYFEVGLAPVSVGSEQEGGFVESLIHVDKPSIAGNGEAILTVSIINTDGSSVDGTFSPTISSRCLDADPAKSVVEIVSSSEPGQVQAIYRPLDCRGLDTVEMTFNDLPGHAASGSIDIGPPSAFSIEQASISHTTIALRDSGNGVVPDKSLVVFTLLDSDGNPAQGAEVNFQLAGSGADASLDRSIDISDESGEVEANVLAGNSPGVVRVTASVSLSSGVLSSTSPDIVISTGRPDSDSLSLVAAQLNPGGGNYDGITTELFISAADRFNGPIPDETVIFLMTEYGRVSATCSTVNGSCAATWSSQSPRRPLFPTFEDKFGEPAYLRTLQNTPCIIGSDSFFDTPCPQSLGQPEGGRTTILAYTKGDESFIDSNGNGVYDSNEPFEDLPEAFMDHNEDGQFGNATTAGSCYPNCSLDGGDEEPFLDDNNNGVYDDGNGIYNGSLCSAAAETAGDCSRAPVTVSASVVIIMSGNEPFGGYYTADTTSPRRLSEMRTSDQKSKFTFYTSDVYNGVLPFGTEISVTSDACPLEGEVNFNVGNTNLPGPSRFELTMGGGTSKEIISGEVTATVTIPESGGIPTSNRFTIPCTVNACSASPQPDFCIEESPESGDD
ncbi:hypothetical protein GCM10027297_18250 [Parahaliea aestuarii]